MTYGVKQYILQPLLTYYNTHMSKTLPVNSPVIYHLVQVSTLCLKKCTNFETV